MFVVRLWSGFSVGSTGFTRLDVQTLGVWVEVDGRLLSQLPLILERGGWNRAECTRVEEPLQH